MSVSALCSLKNSLQSSGSSIMRDRPASLPVLAVDHFYPGDLKLERSCLLIAEHELSACPVICVQTILGKIAPTISPIGSIVKSSRAVQSSKVILTIYYVKRSDEQQAEPS